MDCPRIGGEHHGGYALFVYKLDHSSISFAGDAKLMSIDPVYGSPPLSEPLDHRLAARVLNARDMVGSHDNGHALVTEADYGIRQHLGVGLFVVGNGVDLGMILNAPYGYNGDGTRERYDVLGWDNASGDEQATYSQAEKAT